ncbi:choline dehydrogenase [Actibacterium mucosum KCTC 23349]|uniref:Choline dehydrogenase n=1 Tax=Actibacterium mucosum KCTC 23349 TaxID=1454373 RepID=A0A037ZCV3_9RHOB|nr:GMC family oxidoreductase [Actibacterium mucosum]KAJ53962.1 choline dehydrogenase [Actibacterium mucosum KCTC 23349]
MSEDTVDVVIVGAGASGAAVAWNLAETKMHIVCLDQGPMPESSQYPTNNKDWETRIQNEWTHSPNHRKAPQDYPINDDNSPIKIVNWNGVGGGTVLYAGHMPRLLPSDFRVKTLDGVADDWPVDYDMLQPFFEENEKMMGVSGLEGDPAYPPGKKRVMPPVPLGKTGKKVGEACNELGWHWWPSDTAIATEDYDGRSKCINLGACLFGCAQGAKASTDITYAQHAMRAGVEFRTGARVSQVTTDDEGMATGVLYFDNDGVEHHLKAHIVIVASNGVGTPRLLLNSKSKSHPDGLANSSGLVGKNLMLHPYSWVNGVFEEELDGFRGSHKNVWSLEHYETKADRGFVRGYLLESHRGAATVETVMNGYGWGEIPWGEGHHDAVRALHNRTTSWVAVCEDLPELHNTVTIDPELVDSNGIPAPKIDYTLSENSINMLNHSVEQIETILKTAGATKTFKQVPIEYGGWHLLGTARMGTDPASSVVNEWGRAHDVKNLFIVDGSIFVTSSGVNPTNTIQALALYISDQIKQRLANLFD